MKRPAKPKKPIFIRNDIPRPRILPVEFSFSYSVDLTKITAQEYMDIQAQAHIDADEAWMLSKANEDPEGHWATTYFTRKE